MSLYSLANLGSIIINMLLFLSFCSHIMDKKKVSKKKVISLILFCLILIFYVNTFKNVLANSLTFLIVYGIYELCLFNASLFARILTLIIYMSCGITSEALGYMIINLVFDLNVIEMQSEETIYIIGVVISSLIIFLITKGFTRNLTPQNFKKIPYIYIMILAMPCTSIALIMNIADYGVISTTNGSVFRILIVGLLISNIITLTLFFNIVSKLNMQKENERLKSEKEILDLNNRILELKFKNTRSFIHDMNKHINIISDFLNLGDTPSLKKYIAELSNSIQQNNLKYTNLKILNIIINEKSDMIKKHGIKLKLDIQIDDLPWIDLFDQNVLFSNILDNAIESCIKSNEKYIIVRGKMDEFVGIHITNSCDYALLENGRPKTIKLDSENHGIGLLNVEKVIKKYGGIYSYEFDNINHLFHTKIRLPNRKEEYND